MYESTKVRQAPQGLELEMDENQRRAAWSTLWGVLALIFGGAAVPIWIMALTPSDNFPAWPAWALTVLTFMAVYIAYAFLAARWPAVRKGKQATNVDLMHEQVGNHMRLILVNRGPAAEFLVQVTSILAPLEERKPPHSWTTPWLEDGSPQPKRILAGARQALDFARYDADAVTAELSSGNGDAYHWLFPTAPEAVGARYYNLRSQNDLSLQRFILTVRIMNASSGKYLDRRLSVGIQGGSLICDISPVDAKNKL